MSIPQPGCRSLIQVSHEMVALIGRGPVEPLLWPEGSVAFAFELSDPEGSATVVYIGDPEPTAVEALDAQLILIVTRLACRRLFTALPEHEGVFHIPPNLRSIAGAILHCALPEPARTTLRLAKSIELLCETFLLLQQDMLIPAARDAQLSYRDCERIRSARRLIETRWNEKLTLDSIASACGLNRSKLARGFRDMFNQSVATLIAEHRLGEARQMLTATDLPVSAIGYRCGYLNNAAFTRAFSRRYGVAPSSFRAAALAA
jgi:AraC family transcriptional activator of pyochelin receptor